MQAVILAAGMGKRLGKYTKNNTKCMLPVNGITLIERALDAIGKAGIDSCIMVVGYQKQAVIDFLGDQYKNVKISYISNDIYDKTNNIYSLYLAKDYLLQDDTLLLESDLIFEEKLITDILEDSRPNLAAVALYESWMDGTVIELAENEHIARFIPKKFFNFDKKESYYKTVNIYKFSREFLANIYVPFLSAYSQAMGNNEYYEQVLRVIATLDNSDLCAFILKGQKWYEIDDVADKTIAEIIFSPTTSERLQRLQKAYGGYWRYPGLLDFCYLVNPYFPTKQMFAELEAYFRELLSSYPSGLDTQNLLAAKLFSCDEDCILAGNGAAELIRALKNVLPGSIGVQYPTFNEYPESLGSNEIIPLVPDNFAYTPADLRGQAEKCDTLILINPDNPSGNYIDTKEIIALAEDLKRKGRRLILDESFVDFADSGKNISLIQQTILDACPNLIIIKSLSKSYGIPGLRLGILACGDRDLLKKIRSNLAIWNINSFAEYFLQIIGKYQKDYAAACTRIAEERRRFKGDLEKTGVLQVYDSQANYVLCRIKNGMSGRELAEYLLEHDEIFIKDLSGKKGIPGDEYIRLAVRSTEDNKKLTDCLHKINCRKTESVIE